MRSTVEVRNALLTILLEYLHSLRMGSSIVMVNGHRTVCAAAFYQFLRVRHSNIVSQACRLGHPGDLEWNDRR